MWFDVLLAILCHFSPALPLTWENILKTVEGVKNGRELYWWLGGGLLPISSNIDIKDAVEQFLQGQGYFQPSWRAVIFALDGVGETHCANRIRHYAEPVQGRYMLCD